MDDRLLDEQISEVKAERHAIILSHYYTDYSVQHIADMVGDSFELARAAKDTDAEVILFCGVSFMCESAKMLCYDRTVLSPVSDAGCPMADTVTREDILRLRSEHPDAAVVCYINSSAAVKAECDICCSSANAQKVVRSLPNEEIIFVPDKNLGSLVSELVPEKKFILHDGCCPIHNKVTLDDVVAAKQKYPNTLFLVHPECKKEVRDMADFMGSTSQIIRYASESPEKEFIIGTENGVVDRLSRIFPEKSFYPVAARFVCDDMKKITKQDVLDALIYNRNEVKISKELAERARIPLERMLAVK